MKTISKHYLVVIISAFAIVRLITSCGVKQVMVESELQMFEPDKAKTSFELDMSYDDAWDRIIDFFSERNLTIQTIEKSSGIIVCNKTRFPISYWTYDKGYFKPGAYIAVQYDKQYKADGTGVSFISSWNVRLKKISDTKCVMSVNVVGGKLFINKIVSYYPSIRLEEVEDHILQRTTTGVFEEMMYRYVTSKK